MTESERREPDAARTPPATLGGGPYFVSAVDRRMAHERQRTMVTISRLPRRPSPRGGKRRGPQPGPGHRPTRPLPGPGRTPEVTSARKPPKTPKPRQTRAQSRAKARARATSSRIRWPAALTLGALSLAVAVPFLVQAILLLRGDDRTDGPRAAANPPSSSPSATSTATPAAADPAGRDTTALSTADLDAVRAAVSWTRGALPAAVTIATDAQVVATVRAAGLTGASAFTDADAAGVDYVLDVPEPARDTSDAAARATLLARSLPLATFPASSGTVEVRQVVADDTSPDGTAATSAASVANRESRTDGGRELLRNPRLSPDADMQRALRDGTVDLRALTVLADLTSAGSRVRVGRPVLDPAEQRTGLPIRSLVIGAGDPSDPRALRATAARLRAEPGDYRPLRIDTVSPGSLRVTWQSAIPLGGTY